MNIESLFTDSKWRILTELSHSTLSPTDLANRTGTSIPNISTQLRLMEALDFVQLKKLSNIAKGEPRKLYSLKKEFAYLVLLTNTFAGKKILKLDDENMLFFTPWVINDSKVPYLLIKFYLENESLFKGCQAIGYLGFKDELELLIVHQNPDNLKNINEKFVEKDGKSYKIKCHCHNKEALEHGFNNGDEYFKSIIRKALILLDKEKILSKLKKNE